MGNGPRNSVFGADNSGQPPRVVGKLAKIRVLRLESASETLNTRASPHNHGASVGTARKDICFVARLR